MSSSPSLQLPPLKWQGRGSAGPAPRSHKDNMGSRKRLALCRGGTAERSETFLLPKKEDWPFSGPGPACGPKAEWVKVAEGLEASLLLPLAQSPIPLRAASCGGHNSGQSKQLECDRQKSLSGTI